MSSARTQKLRLVSILAAPAALCALVLRWMPPELAEWHDVDFGLDGTAASVFAASRLLVFEFEVKPGDIRLMRDKARDEVSVPARLQVGNRSVGMVGLRYKGSLGTLGSVLDERRTASYMPKLSMKVEFDRVVAGGRFCGMRRLNFHSMIHDRSLMRDRLCYQVFREAAIAAPRCSHAMVVINGENLGVYAMVEQIDEAFVADRFPGAADGILYKEVWPTSRSSRNYDDAQRWNPRQRDHEFMLGFANALRSATPRELPAVVAQRADLDDLLRYYIVDQALENWDGVRGWTSARVDGVRWNHNYYWYLSPQQRLTLIPWDLDSTLSHPGPREDLRPWYDLAEPETRGHATSSEWFAWSPAHDPLTRGVAMHARGRFERVARELLDGPFAIDHLLHSIDRWQEQIRAAVAHDPYLGNLWEWERRVHELREQLRAIRAWMEVEVRDWDDTLPPSLR